MEFDNNAQSIILEKDRESSWAKINMSREPVNSMNYAFWQRLTDILQACEQSSDIRGVVFYRRVLNG
jgi:enoyl-CoA hydratase/carnithine racemase